MTRISRSCLRWGTLLVFFFCASRAHAGSEIDIEAVDVYQGSMGSCQDLSNNILNVDNFRGRMLTGTGFYAGIRYVDPNVWMTDFIDPQRSGGSGGDDTSNFDRGGQPSAIAYYSGHGSCNDQTTSTCYSASGCPTIAGLQKSCVRFNETGGLFGTCSYSQPRTLVVAPSGTCQSVNYSSGPVGFGESASHTWGGVGYDGGVNFAVLDVSCGLTPGFEYFGVANLWSGLSSVGTLMPTRYGDDTADVPNRGKAWADRFISSASSPIAAMWGDAINGTTGGFSCFWGGGGHGFNGCGAAVAISVDSTQAGASWAAFTEPWTQITNDGNDALGTGWWYYTLICNYDCNNHPILLP